jgi:hypothetical protein
VKFQAQAVLRRDDWQAPLRLAGVLVAGSFYPGAPQDAWGPLHLEAGLVALAPLTPVVITTAPEAAVLALAEAGRQWADGNSPVDGLLLTWRPMRDVRQPADGRSVGELIALMSKVNDARLVATPSTRPYHTAARELERLATVVYDTTSSEERDAEDAAHERDDPPRNRRLDD